MKVRRAESRDYEGLRSLWEEFGRVYTENELMAPLGIKWYGEYHNEDKMIAQAAEVSVGESDAGAYGSIADASVICYVAEDEKGALVGFIQGRIMVNAEKIYSKCGFIDDWFVTASARGTGIGKRLWEALMVDFAEVDYLQLEAYASNPAIETYKKLGFVVSEVKMVKKKGEAR